MTFYVTDQNIVVLSLIILGAGFGLLWDLFGVILDKSGAGAVIVNITELVLCFVFAFVYQVTVFVTNYGYVRWYEFAGVAAGWMLYRLTLSRAVRTILAFVINIITGIFVKILSAVSYPFLWAAKKTGTLLKLHICGMTSRISEKRMMIFSVSEQKRQIRLSQKGFIVKNERIYNEHGD